MRSNDAGVCATFEGTESNGLKRFMASESANACRTPNTRPRLPGSGADRASGYRSTDAFPITRAQREKFHDMPVVTVCPARARTSVARGRTLSSSVSGPSSSNAKESNRIPSVHSRSLERVGPGRRPNSRVIAALQPIPTTLGKSSRSRPCPDRSSRRRIASAVTFQRPGVHCASPPTRVRRPSTYNRSKNR